MNPTEETFEPGMVIKERFALSEVLGEEPSKTWWLAVDLKTGTPIGVALLKNAGSDPSIARGFLTEAKRIAAMPGQPLIEFGQSEGGTLFFAVHANEVGTAAGMPPVSAEQRKRCGRALNQRPRLLAAGRSVEVALGKLESASFSGRQGARGRATVGQPRSAGESDPAHQLSAQLPVGLDRPRTIRGDRSLTEVRFP